MHKQRYEQEKNITVKTFKGFRKHNNYRNNNESDRKKWSSSFLPVQIKLINLWVQHYGYDKF